MNAAEAIGLLAEELAANGGKVPEHIAEALKKKTENPFTPKIKVTDSILREAAKKIAQKTMYGSNNQL